MKNAVLAVLFLVLSWGLGSQNDTRGDFWNAVRFGGGVGLNVGNGFFSGSLAPAAIYDFNSYFSAGVGLNGSYNALRNDFSSTIFGGSLIALFHPITEIQLSTEFEHFNASQRFKNINTPDTRTNFWDSALFVGVGFRTGNTTVGIRYDVLHDKDRSVFADPLMPFVRFWF
jgi:hypothetical protein